MATAFRIHLYDTHYNVYKNNKLFISTDVPNSFYSETILCFDEEDSLSPRGFSSKYFYHFLLESIGLSPNNTSVNDFRTTIK